MTYTVLKVLDTKFPSGTILGLADSGSTVGLRNVILTCGLRTRSFWQIHFKKIKMKKSNSPNIT